MADFILPKNSKIKEGKTYSFEGNNDSTKKLKNISIKLQKL